MIIAGMRAQSVLSKGIPFPDTVSEPPSPSQCGPSDLCITVPTDMPTDMAYERRGSRSPPKKSSLRWRAIPDRSGSSTIFRIPSFSSTTTSASTLQHTGFSSLVKSDASSECIDAPSHPLSCEHHMASKRNTQDSTRSIFQFFAKSLPREKSGSLQPRHSVSSPSLPSSPGFADTFASKAHPTDSSPGSSHEHSSLTVRSDPVRDPSALRDGKKNVRDLSKAAQRSTGKNNAHRLVKRRTVPFDPRADVTPRDLESAQDLQVFDQDGVGVKFGNLWQGQRTCVIFIRHFWCSMCMDYATSIVDQVHPDALHRAGVRLVVISNGSPAMIKSYKSIFKFPFHMYTDPSLAVYRALGMTLRTLDGGPESERGQYIQHGMATGIAMVLKNAVKARMPIHKNGGDLKQLGGEFVLGPGLCCSYASRMRTTRSHTPILDVLSAAGVKHDAVSVVTFHPETFSNEEQWMEEREAELMRMRARKGLRRGFMSERRSIESYECESESADESDGSDGGGYHSDI